VVSCRSGITPESDYEDYPQIDNGVGSIRSFLKQFSEALSSYRNELSTTTILGWWATLWKSISADFAPTEFC